MNGGNNVRQSAFFCVNCGGQLEFWPNQEFAVCPYCGTRYHVSALLGESNEVRLEKIRLQEFQAQSAANAVRMQNEYQMAQQAERMAEKAAVKAAHDKYRRGIASKLMPVFSISFILFWAFAFYNKWTLTGIIGVAISALFMLSWLLGMQIIKEKSRGMHVFAALMAFLLIPVFFISPKLFYDPQSSYEQPPENIVWSYLTLGDALPEPDKTYGDVSIDTDDTLWVDISDSTEGDFRAYRQKCIDSGYTIDADKGSTSYSAFNSQGYELRISYGSYNKELSITLHAPEELDTLEWPDSGLAVLLPVPNSDIGRILCDSSDEFAVHIGNMTTEQFNEYVEQCKEKGFTLNSNKTETVYTAESSDNYTLRVDYEGFNIISIEISKMEDQLDLYDY